MTIQLPELTPLQKEEVKKHNSEVTGSAWSNDPLGRTSFSLFFFGYLVATLGLALPILASQVGLIPEGLGLPLGAFLALLSFAYGATSMYRLNKKLWGKGRRSIFQAALTKPAKFVVKSDGSTAVEVEYVLQGERVRMRFDHFVTVNSSKVDAIRYQTIPESKAVENGNLVVAVHTKTGEPLTLGPKQETIVGPAIIYVR